MQSGKLIAKPLSTKQKQNLQRDNSKTEGIESAEIEEGKQQVSVFAVPGPQVRKGTIGSRTAAEASS